MNKYKNYGKRTKEVGRARGRGYIERDGRRRKNAKVIRMSCGTGYSS